VVEVVNLEDKFARFSEHWSPKILARLNDYHIKAVKLRGEFVWHKHDDTDELFLVTKGALVIRFRDREVTLGPGELLVVPKGVEHQPVAGVGHLEGERGAAGIQGDLAVGEEDLARNHAAPSDRTGWCTVTSLVPSGKVASTWISSIISGIPAMT
jgi:hypothetical protein